MGPVYVELFAENDRLLQLFTLAVDGAVPRDKSALYRLTDTWKSTPPPIPIPIPTPTPTSLNPTTTTTAAAPLFPLTLLAKIDDFIHDRIRLEFRAALSELRTIELPVIKSLTSMAESLSQFAASIITPIIEDHVKNVKGLENMICHQT